jgi:hypothetical protein
VEAEEAVAVVAVADAVDFLLRPCALSSGTVTFLAATAAVMEVAEDMAVVATKVADEKSRSCAFRF